jgi:hypothetical protein
MKKIILILSLILSLYVEAQNNNLNGAKNFEIGTKWWYSSSKGGLSPITRNGFALLEIEKDTLFDNIICKKISVNEFIPRASDTTLVKYELKPFFLNKSDGVIKYKFLTDSIWFILYDSSWSLNDTFTLKIREKWNGDNPNKYQNVEFKVQKKGAETISGAKFNFITISPTKESLFIFENKFYENIGYKSYFLNTFNDFALDGVQPFGIRCINEGLVNQIISFDALTCEYYSIEDFSNTPPCCVSTSGNRSLENENINIYPNPTNDEINIDNISNTNTFYQIFRINGEIVKTGLLNNSSIQIKEIPNGLYFLIIQNESKKTTFKFLKK